MPSHHHYTGLGVWVILMLGVVGWGLVIGLGILAKLLIYAALG